MLRNYFLIALRNLLKQRTFNIINLISLSLGMTLTFLILLNVYDELSFDSFHKDPERIYRVVHKWKENYYGQISIPIANGITENIPEVENSVKMKSYLCNLLINSETFNEKLTFVDKGFFQMFSFQILDGNPDKAFQNISSAIISENFARKFFSHSPLGSLLQIKLQDSLYNFTVAAVIKDAPSNSSIQYSIIIPFENALKIDELNLASDFGMNPSISPSFIVKTIDAHKKWDIQNKIRNVSQKYLDSKIFKESTFLLEPITDMRFNNNIQYNGFVTKDFSNILIFIAVGLFSLIVACINFINLSLTRSSFRFKEVGMRKVFGAQKKDIILQFISESTGFTIIAFLFSVSLIQLLLPYFNQIIGKNLQVDFLSNVSTLLIILILVLTVGLIAGSYPSFILSRIEPNKIFKSKQTLIGPSKIVKFLLVFQFLLSVSLIIILIVLYRQVSFIDNYDLGFNQKNIIVLKTDRFNKNTLEIFSKEILKYPQVQSSTISTDIPGLLPLNMTPFSYNDEVIPVNTFRVDYNYLSTLEIKLKSGRNFSKDYTSDIKDAIIVNDIFLKELNISNPVNKKVKIGDKEKLIIGVIKDYHYGTLKEKIAPLALDLDRGGTGMEWYLFIKSETNAQLLSKLEQEWKRISPSTDFNYFYLDEFIAKNYEQDKMWLNIIKGAAIMSMVIACLGILGMVIFSAESKTKEIGIRKVLGASVFQIAKSLSKEMIILMLVANAIAFPIAYLFMVRWLEGFAYYIPIGLIPFIIAFLISLLLLVFPISYQLIKIINTDPINSIRYE